MDKIEFIWLGATVLLFILEAVTVNLVSVWFALGSLAALIASLLGAKLWLQIVVFFIVTILTLIATRPLVKKYFNKKDHEPTNADAVIGRICVVTQDVDNLSSSGQASCMGSTWTVRSKNGEIIKEGSKAKVLSIEGVKLIIEEVPDESL